MDWNKSYVYFGSADISRRILIGLIKAGYRPALVVSTINKPAGRGLKNTQTPVAEYAEQNKLPLVLVSSFKKGLSMELQKSTAKLGILAAFGKIIPQTLLDLFPFGIINVHPSLLPLYRGSSPIQSALMDGVTITGVTIIKLDAEVDHGPIISQQSIEVNSLAKAPDLEIRLAEVAISQLLDCVPKYLAQELVPKEQPHEQATFTHLIKKADGYTNFSEDAQVLNNKQRALTPWPGLWTNWSGQRLKLIDTSISALSEPLTIGQVAQINNKIMIRCANNSALVLETIQLAGSTAQNIRAFINGHQNFIGSILG